MNTPPDVLVLEQEEALDTEVVEKIDKPLVAKLFEGAGIDVVVGTAHVVETKPATSPEKPSLV